MRYFGIFAFIFIFQTVTGQAKNELPFIRHLVNKEYYKEAIFLIDNNTYHYQNQQLDSLNYFHGWAHYSLKNLGKSTTSFLEVRTASPFYHKSHFFAGYNQLFLENYSNAQNIFTRMSIEQEPRLSLLNFELSGMEMLRGNWQQGKKQLELVNRENAALNQQVMALEKIYDEHESHRPKSPLLAGIMSGIVPGSGKIYAGKTGAGIASFIGTVGFGFIAWENYRKLGFGHAKTIIFGSIFAFNYVSNIYGSVISVKISENEYKNAVRNQILFQLHVPLRNFFE